MIRSASAEPLVVGLTIDKFTPGSFLLRQQPGPHLLLMYTLLLYSITVTWWIVFCLVSCYFFGIKSLMLDLTTYIQILHNLLCASVCHFANSLPICTQRPVHADKGTQRVCGNSYLQNLLFALYSP